MLPPRTRDLDLFRPAEDRMLFVVRERETDRSRAAGLRGFVLQRPEDYDRHAPRDAPPEPRSAGAASAGVGAGSN